MSGSKDNIDSFKPMEEMHACGLKRDGVYAKMLL